MMIPLLFPARFFVLQLNILKMWSMGWNRMESKGSCLKHVIIQMVLKGCGLSF